MGRKPSIADQDILYAARDVFLSQGVHATTQEVAKRAQVSEASVFKRFKTKAALFQAAMAPHLEVPSSLNDLAVAPPSALRKKSVATHLEHAGLALLELVRVRMPLTMLAWSNRGVCDPTGPDGPEPFLQQMIHLISTYVQREIDAGRMVDVDAPTFARSFTGGIAHYVMTAIFAPDKKEDEIQPTSFVIGLVDLLLHGALASPRPRRLKSKRSRWAERR